MSASQCRAYARQAENFELAADATEIRMRATRRMDEMRREQKETEGVDFDAGKCHSLLNYKGFPTAFLTVDDVAALQAAADKLSPAIPRAA
jgi:hypothetical protein